ncbi:con-10 family general stress protein [Pseudomonas sp. OV577]
MSTQDKQGQMSVNEAGKKGGEATSASHDKEFYQEIGSKGGQNSGGNFANDREKASEAGRKGGEHSHGGGRNS